MVREVTVSAKTIEAAVEKGASELGADLSSVEFEVLEQPSRGFLGIGASDAKVRVYIQITPADKAVEFIQTVLKDMGLTATVSVKSTEDDGATVSVSGTGLGALIGRRGEVLDSIQYLSSLAANRVYDGFYRITLDVEGYREKREETLRRLAQRQAEKVLKYKRSFALEPMNPYERRVIHTAIQEIPGVATYSIGQDAERRIVICLEGKEKNRK